MKVFYDIHDLMVYSDPLYLFFKDLVNITGYFEEDLGGNLVIIEEYDELSLIHTCRESEINPGQWASILEYPDSFDDCRYIVNGQYVIVFNATNDNGGDSFVIPRAIANRCHNIINSIEMTTEAWSGDRNVNN